MCIPEEGRPCTRQTSSRERWAQRGKPRLDQQCSAISPKPDLLISTTAATAQMAFRRGGPRAHVVGGVPWRGYVERAVQVTEAHRIWWRERFTREEILWMADALFGEER
jgi:hypothetical protein